MPRTRTATPKAKATTTKAPAAPRRRSTRRATAPVPHDAVAERAYHLFLAEGGGDSVAHWLRAEQELRAA
jgi:hypothetical protein